MYSKKIRILIVILIEEYIIINNLSYSNILNLSNKEILKYQPKSDGKKIVVLL